MSIWKSGKQKFAVFLINDIQKICSLNKNAKLQFKCGFGISSFDLLIECINLENILGSIKEIHLEKIVYDVIENLLLAKQVINEKTFVNEFNIIKSKQKYQNTISYQLVV